jgi:hypothetical protein
MNTPSALDTRARQLHATAATQLSPQTLARLRAARHAALHDPSASRPGLFARPWLAASAFSVALLALVGVGLLRQPTLAPSSPSQMAEQAPADGLGLPPDLDGVADDPYAELDANPDLFVWLGSDSQPLAME